MFAMKIGGILEMFGQLEGFGLTKKFSQETNARGRAILREAGWHDHAGVAREIANQQPFARKTGSDDDVEFLKHFRCVLDEQMANALGLDEFHRRHEAFHAKGVRPGPAQLGQHGPLL